MLIRAGQYVQELFPELTKEPPTSPQTERRVDKVESIRRARTEGTQDLSFGARPFILCGLPIRRLPAGHSPTHVGTEDFTSRLSGILSMGFRSVKIAWCFLVSHLSRAATESSCAIRERCSDPD